MQKQHFFLLLAFLFLLVFTACHKHDDETKAYADLGSLEIEFDLKAGDENLTLNRNYITAAGDTVNFTAFDFFVSNFVLVREDGSEYVVPKNQSYFLVKQNELSSQTIKLSNVPGGAYKAVRFIIGVDSLMSATPAEQRPAVLDPITTANGMYWSWNSGYIFVKVAGTSPQAPVNASTQERTIMYHVGGYGGNDPANPTMNNLKTVTLEKSGELAQVGKLGDSDHSHGGTGEDGVTPHIHSFVDILQVFSGPTTVRVADNPILHWGNFAQTLADNYKDMIVMDHVHN
jgi:hypothetical protein